MWEIIREKHPIGFNDCNVYVNNINTFGGIAIMKKYITDETNGLDYTLVNGFYLPNLVSTETNYEIGVWGMRYYDYIKEHRPAFCTSLMVQCKLNTHLHEVDIRATEMYDHLVNQLKEQQGITEKLKAENMMAWVQAMNNITNQSREIVNVVIISII